MRTTAVAAGAIIFSAVAAVPFVCGQVLEREIREAIDGYNKRQAFVTASVVRCDRHFKRSEFVTRLAVRAGPELVRATTRPRHAPFAEAYAATEHYYFGGRTPLAIDFDVEFGGGASGVLRSAPVEKPLIASPSTRVVAGASSGRFNIAKDKAFQFEWTLPKGAYEDPKLCMGVGGLAMSAYGQLDDDDLSEGSGFKLSIASYRGVQGSQNTSVRDFSISTQTMPSKDTLRVALAVRTGAGEVVLDAGPYVWE
jgi:hypothetical protein